MTPEPPVPPQPGPDASGTGSPPPGPPSPGSKVPTGVDPVTQSDPRYLGPFRLVGRLGAGGMGVVYAGLDDRDRRVAVKSVHRVLASDADFRARFAREVGLVRRVRATCVPAFLGSEARAEIPWLATEYVPGPTLDERVRANGPLQGEALTAFALGVAEALAAIHAQGVVHRDLKPGNVILAPDGPKVLDFGIARAVDGTALTKTGGMVGTPGWISPEQYKGAPATERSDVFSWAGLVVYAATGEGPFGEGSSEAVVGRILSEAPSLEGAPAPMRDLLERALDKDPERRPGAADLLRSVAGTLGAADDPDITRVLGRSWSGDPSPDDEVTAWTRTAPPRRSWFRRNRLVLAAGSVLLVLALAAGLGARALSSEGTAVLPGQDVAEAEGADGSENGDGAEDAAPGVPDDTPEEHRELYDSGEPVVEPASETEPVLIRRLVPATGAGEALDQLRLTFEEVSITDFTSGVTVEAEYLPEHGSLRVHSNDFYTVSTIGPDQEGLGLTPVSNSGVLAELDPQRPTARFRLTMESGQVIYYVPEELFAAAGDSLDYPGGFCIATADEVPSFPGNADFGPHDTALTGSVPIDSCAYTEDDVP
ncbi:serine/threonine-protein kinase [Nocardiopsis nanhaiensis]